MLGRNPMRFNKTRLRDNRGLRNKFFDCQMSGGILIAIACVISVAGCSRLGSTGPLNQGRIPFPPQPLRDASSESVAAEKAKAMESAKTARDLHAIDNVDNAKLANQVRSETNPARDAVQDLKARPPKLSQLPSTTLYAEPVIDNAQQVAFEEKENDFDPARQPPAEIFAQPLAKTKDDQFFDPRPVKPTVNPEKFVASDPQPAALQAGMLNPIRDNRTPATESQRIMLVTNTSTDVPEAHDAASAAKATEATVAVTDAIGPPLPLNRQLVKNFAPAPLRPEMPVIIEKTPEEVNNGPKVDANLKGEVYTKSAPPQIAEKPPEVKEIFAPEKAAEKVADKPVIKDELPKIEEIKVEEFQQNFSPAQSLTQTKAPEPEIKPEFKAEPSNGIEIDPTLGAQRDERLSFTAPRKITKAQPEPKPESKPVVFESKKAPLVQSPLVKKILPEVKAMPEEKKLPEVKAISEVKELPEVKEIPEAIETRVARIEQPAFAPALVEKEILPVKKCATCDHPDCNGCNIPSDNQFSEAAPTIQGRRSLAPMPVERSTEPVEIAKKNFGQVAFAPVGLPLPQTVTDDAENIAAAFNQQIPEEEFVKTNAQSDVPPVGVEAVLKLNEITWRSRLQQTISLVKDQLSSDIDSQTRTSLEINLRLLDVLSRQMGDIAKEERSFTQSENEFWQHQLEAITSMLQTPELTNEKAHDLMKHHTAHDTLVHLRHAIAELESLANLKIESGAFCTEVSGYGQFKTFASDVFESGQKVLVYCEVENYNSVQQNSASGPTFHTRLRGSYAIYDADGHAVQQAEFPVVEDIARRRRRDFYMHLPIGIGDLSNGDYELHLLVEDLGGNKTASLTPPLRFSVSSGNPVDLQARTRDDGHLVR